MSKGERAYNLITGAKALIFSSLPNALMEALMYREECIAVNISNCLIQYHTVSSFSTVYCLNSPEIQKGNISYLSKQESP